MNKVRNAGGKREKLLLHPLQTHPIMEALGKFFDLSFRKNMQAPKESATYIEVTKMI